MCNLDQARPLPVSTLDLAIKALPGRQIECTDVGLYMAPQIQGAPDRCAVSNIALRKGRP